MAFNFSNPYRQILEFKSPLKRETTPYSNYLKGVLWCPDGSTLLTAAADKKFRLFSTPDETGVGGDGSLLEIKEGEMIYDYCWYPYANALHPQTYCFLSTSRVLQQGHPLHLWDADSGDLRASYRCFDLADEIAPCVSVSFTPDGTELYCGAKNRIYTFDISRPGRDYTCMTTFDKTDGGIKGIISAIAFSKAYVGVYAVGSYNSDVGIFTSETQNLQLRLSRHVGGVTQLLFSQDGCFLYSGARRDGSIYCWDIRAPTDPVYNLHRDAVRTNQRISFDIEPVAGRFLITGSDSGRISIFDLITGTLLSHLCISPDAVNGVAYHPWKTLLAATTGRRHFARLDGDIDHALRVLAFDSRSSQSV